VANPGFATTNTLTVNEPPFGGATASQTPSELNLSVSNGFTSNFDTLTWRTGQFVAPEAGVYTFSLDFSGSLEINDTNTEIGNNVATTASTFMEYTKNNATNNNQDGNFVFESDLFIITDVFDAQTFSGTTAITQTFGGNDVTFAQGDLITFNASTRVQTRSFSSQPPVLATPIPAALPLLLSGLGMLLLPAARRRRRGA
jgi:hypothetical protein